MGRKKKRFRTPRVLHAPLTVVLRSALDVALIAGMRPTAEAACAAGMAFAASPLNRKRLARAESHIAEAFPQLGDEARRELALRSYEHLFTLGAEIAFAPRLLSEDSWSAHLAFGEISSALRALLTERPTMLITGHVGNWELVGFGLALLGFPFHAIYRPLDNKPLDRWLRSTRERRGLHLLSKFGALRELKPVLERAEAAGFVADQNGGDRGVFVPFFGRLCSTYKSIGLLALTHNANVVCGFARRVPPGADPSEMPPGCRFDAVGSLRHIVEVVDVFGPEDWARVPDPLFYVSARFRHAIERMIRRCPEQYLWMHRLWRARPPHERFGKPFPPALREKLSWLPWMTPEAVERVVERSARDAHDIKAGRPV